MEYYGSGNTSLEFPFNFVLLSNGAESTRPSDIKGYVDEWVDALPTGGISNWVVSPISGRYSGKNPLFLGVKEE